MTARIRWQQSTADDAVAYPAAPWPLAGSMWLTLLRLGRPAGERHPAGLYGVACVSYDEPSPLTYRELLVARPARTRHGRRVTVTDIWVDSAASVAGGRELWAIPKQLAELDQTVASDGGTTGFGCRVEGRPVAAVHLGRPGPAPRLPFRAGLWHPGLPDTGGLERLATMRGTARVSPARARWTFAPEGPLGWLAGARQLGSVTLSRFRMDVG